MIDSQQEHKKARMPGVKRPAPACAGSPAFVAAGVSTRWRPGRPGAIICAAQKRNGTPCGMLALSGLKVCGVHGGYSIKARRGEYVPKRKRHAFKAEDLGHAVIGLRDVTPDRKTLLALPVWRMALSHGERARLTMAFDRRTDDPALWRKALKEALEQAKEREAVL